MKRIISVIGILLVLLLLYACSSQEPLNTISNELGIDVSNGDEISNMDNHGGFHGDGTTYIVLSFSDGKVLEQIKEHSQWKAFPLNETVKTLIYGTSDETTTMGPILTDDEGNALIPEIQRGYYCLIDRQAKSEKATGADILHRNSFNFTLGLYDMDTDTLHLCRFDT